MNVIFNPYIRDEIDRFRERFFDDFARYTDKIWAVDATLTNDLFYPFVVNWHGKACGYWAFDEYARRQQPFADGRWPSLTGAPHPLPQWADHPGPGVPDPDPLHKKATAFVNWYLDSANAAIQWNLNGIRKRYKGKIFLYGQLFTEHFDLKPFIQHDLNCTTFEDYGNGIFQPSLGVADGRYLEAIKKKFSDDEIIVHNSGLEDLTDTAIEKTRRYFSKVGGEEATVAAENFPYTNAKGHTFHTARDIMRDMTEKVRKYGLYEFFWYGSSGLYEENLDPATRDRYNVGPLDFAKMIEGINGSPATISGLTASRINTTTVQVSWTTSEPADSRVVYAKDKTLRASVGYVYDPVKTTAHRLQISAVADTPLYFEVGSDNGKKYILSQVQRLE